MASRPRLAVDCMGGDGGPAVTTSAAYAVRDHATVSLFGDRRAIQQAAVAAGIPSPDAGWASVVHSDLAVSADDGLRRILRQGAASSLGLALQQLRNDQVDAVISAGDTAAVMSLSRHLLGTLNGVARPAIAREFLGKQGPFWMADLGANVSCTADQLHAFGRQLVVAARMLSGIDAPRCALLNIGVEQGKGPELLRRTAQLLDADAETDFIGYVEPSELFENRADVVICEGFVGNIALKSIEGTASMARHMVRREIAQSSLLQRMVLGMLRPVVEGIRHGLDTDRYNGAQLLGLPGVVVKSHGSATSRAFEFALRRAIECVDQALPERLAAAAR
ncbi:MAG: phosphate acyltransferase PlsX [Pseudomonadota bacterium]